VRLSNPIEYYEVDAMRCDTCGAEFDSKEKFCPKCGTPRPHQLPSLNKVQSAGPTREEEFKVQEENGKSVLSTGKRYLLLAIVILASLGLMVLLYMQFVPR
jgi:hypothetical protein